MFDFFERCTTSVALKVAGKTTTQEEGEEGDGLHLRERIDPSG